MNGEPKVGCRHVSNYSYGQLIKKSIKFMYIRATTPADLSEMSAIYDYAISFMHSHGNPHQWVNGYPSVQLLREDINLCRSYVCVNEWGWIVGVFCLIYGEEPSYRRIMGHWLNDLPYATIHRVASSGSQHGVFKACADWCKQQCPNLRIDTHEDNKIMQSAVLRNGFQRCGIVHLEDGSPRIAYQWSAAE